MKLNMHILFDELSRFNPRLYSKNDTELYLLQARLPLLSPTMSGDDISRESVFVMMADDFINSSEIFKDVDVIIIGDIEHSAYQNQSMMVIPRENDLIFLFTFVQGIFGKYALWNLDMVYSISRKEPSSVFGQIASKMLSNPFVLLDPFMTILMVGSKETESFTSIESIWSEIIKEKTTQTQQNGELQIENFFNHQQQGRKPYAYNGVNKSDDGFILMNGYIFDELFFYIGIKEIYAPLTKGQISLAAHIRDVFELEFFSKLDASVSKMTLSYYLILLLDGKLVDMKVLSYYLLQHGWEINGNFHVFAITAAVEYEHSDNRFGILKEHLKNIDNDLLIEEHGNTLVVIVRNQDNIENSELSMHLSNLLGMLNMHSGCSQRFESFIDLQCYYLQALAALDEGKRRKANQIMWYFGSMYFSHVSSILERAGTWTYLCHPSVVALIKYDDENNTDFVHCLRSFIFNGCNISQTAKDLYMHRNTLSYKLARIAEIIDTDIALLPESTRMQLWFSCMISSYSK
ncbi:MAG: helix-turn-helix domain-containing protein [Oscillospiraceae bacterium]|nr:helix-turn-helix domain-containing protein [Oscillospiraceae bacterium]